MPPICGDREHGHIWNRRHGAALQPNQINVLCWDAMLCDLSFKGGLYRNTSVLEVSLIVARSKVVVYLTLEFGAVIAARKHRMLSFHLN
jgi:hypothetical protein